MKLELLRVFAQDCAAELGQEVGEAEFFYQSEGVWKRGKDAANIVDPPTILALNKSAGESVAHHQPSSAKAWYYFPSLKAVICVTHSSSPRLKTREETRRRLQIVLQHTTNAYKATHNQLTDLLARDAMKQFIGERLSGATGAVGITATTEGTVVPIVSVLALDIDRFKQVNDTYGHLYGDQVLRAFALRLTKILEHVAGTLGPSVEAALAHPSGEEFLVVLFGPISSSDVMAVAETIRHEIIEIPLPSDEEWELLSNQSDLSKLTFPRASERALSASIGVAIAAPKSTVSSLTADVLQLLDRADMALYRSKAGGRNRVTAFEDILQHCGRVLEHNLHTGTVAIDIGSRVGLAVGQEFRVYPPSFVGSTPYTIDDGRSKRTLGVYPKVEVSRIVVFDVQHEMAFAWVSLPTASAKQIEPGSSLEAVPLGSISHLLHDSKSILVGRHDSRTIPGGPELQKVIEDIKDIGGRPCALVTRFVNEKDYLEKYGSAALNSALAQLYSTTVSTLKTGHRIGIIDGTCVCAVADAEFFHEDSIQTVFTNANHISEELIVAAGYFVPEEEQEAADEARLDDGYAINFARYAASDYVQADQRQPERFTAQTAERLLKRLREVRLFEQGIVDHDRLVKAGVRSADLENSTGLCYSALGRFSEAIKCYETAIEFAPTVIVYRANVGVNAYRLGEIERGLRVLLPLTEPQLERLAKAAPFGFLNYALLLVKARELGLPSYDKAKFIRVGKVAVGLPPAKAHPDLQGLERALAEVEEQG